MMLSNAIVSSTPIISINQECCWYSLGDARDVKTQNHSGVGVKVLISVSS